MKKEELLIGASEIFALYPAEDKILATSDGHFFLPKAHSLALHHAQHNGLGDLIEIKREDLKKKAAKADPPPATPPATPPAPPVKTVEKTTEGQNEELANHEKPDPKAAQKKAEKPVKQAQKAEKKKK